MLTTYTLLGEAAPPDRWFDIAVTALGLLQGLALLAGIFSGAFRRDEGKDGLTTIRLGREGKSR